MGLDLILYWKTHNYQKVILLNLKMSWCAWWPIFLLLVLFKIYFKSLILRFEIFKGKTLSVISVFTALILLLLFQMTKTRQCCGFTFTNFSVFLQPPMPLRLDEYFLRTLVYFLCFPYFLIRFSLGNLMEISSTHVYFRSGTIMLCLDKKDKNTFKDDSQ